MRWSDLRQNYSKKFWIKTLTALTLALTNLLTLSVVVILCYYIICAANVLLYKQIKWWFKAFIEWSIDWLHWMPYCSNIYWWSDIIFIAIDKHWLRQHLLSNCSYDHQIVIYLYEVLTHWNSLHILFVVAFSQACISLGGLLYYWLFIQD